MLLWVWRLAASWEEAGKFRLLFKCVGDGGRLWQKVIRLAQLRTQILECVLVQSAYRLRRLLLWELARVGLLWSGKRLLRTSTETLIILRLGWLRLLRWVIILLKSCCGRRWHHVDPFALFAFLTLLLLVELWRSSWLWRRLLSNEFWLLDYNGLGFQEGTRLFLGLA